MKLTKVIVRHRPGVDVRALLRKAFQSLAHDCDEHLVKDVQADIERMDPEMRKVYLQIRGRFEEQAEIAFEQVTQAAQQAVEAPPPSGWKKLFVGAALLFPLAAAVISRILRPIYDLAVAVNYEQFGLRPDPRSLRRLRRLGLIAGKPKSLSELAFMLGTGRDSVDEHQRIAVDLLERRGARAITDMVDSLAHDVGGMLEARDADLGRLAAAATEPNKADVRRMLVAAQRDRLGWRRLRSAMKRRFGDLTRDWDRIAVTELEDANQTAQAVHIASTSPRGMRTVVYRIPRPDACRVCKKLYLNEDGSPKRFVLGDLFAAGSNIGRVAPRVGGRADGGRRQVLQGERAGQDVEEYLPVIGQSHPYCRCRLVVAEEMV